MKLPLKFVFTNIIGLGMFVLSSIVNSAPILDFNISNTTPTIGETISVDIVATDVTDLYAFNLDMAFDASILSVSSVLPGNFLNSGGLTLGDIGSLGFNLSTVGEIQDINDSLLGPVSGVTGTGILASVTFDVIGTGISSLLSLNMNAPAGTELVDSAGSSIILSAVTGGTVTVSSVPEPTVIFLLGTGIASLLIFRRFRTEG